MIESINKIVDLIFDKTKTIGSRLARFISLIAFILLVDISLNVSFNIHNSFKLDQLEKIAIIKEQSQGDTQKIAYLELMENDIYLKEHYSEFVPRIISHISLPSFNNSQNIPQSEKATIKPIKPTRNIYWMFLSSNWLIILGMSIAVYQSTFGKDGDNSEAGAKVIASLFSVVIFGLIVTWLAYKIPLIYGKPYLNYILNFSIQFVFVIIISIMAVKDKK